MFTNRKRVWLLLLASALVLSICACGSNQTGSTENNTETETEVIVEIADANDILTKIWDCYEEADTDGNMFNDRFDVMGGHFESAVMNMPAKYDLTKTSDLELMYCVPQSAAAMIDDAATIVHLMKASTFTTGAYHVADVANMQTVTEGMENQILSNQWLGGFPDKMLVIQLDEQYVIAGFGTAEVMDSFKKIVFDIYGNQANILAEKSIR